MSREHDELRSMEEREIKQLVKMKEEQQELFAFVHDTMIIQGQLDLFGDASPAVEKDCEGDAAEKGHADDTQVRG